MLDPALSGGVILVFTGAAAATAWDCYTTRAKRIARVPGFIVVHLGVLVLCAVCGIVAAAAFCYTDPKGGDVVSTALTLNVQSPVLRGLAVGTTVLVLLRRKLFNMGNTGFGGEAAFAFFRDLAIQSVNDRRTVYRDRFMTLNAPAAFATANYFHNLEALVNNSVQSRKPEYQQRARDELKAVASAKPATAMSAADLLWDAYYRAITGIGYDYCGPEVLQAVVGFRRLPWPGRWG
ncbi:MAG TPA: hypothetical protein VND19_06410 [Acetobacteraceae bacterium]|nr:hypothetical protein [Acetobacteraceae bacterium]